MTHENDYFEFRGNYYIVQMDFDLDVEAIDHKAGIFDGVVKGCDILTERPVELGEYKVFCYQDNDEFEPVEIIGDLAEEVADCCFEETRENWEGPVWNGPLI